VEQRLVSLASLLGLANAAAAAAVAAQAPAVLLEPPGMAEAQIGNLARILAVKPGEAAALAGQHPGLLLLPPQVMRSRLETLAATLKVGAAAGVCRVSCASKARGCYLCVWVWVYMFAAPIQLIKPSITSPITPPPVPGARPTWRTRAWRPSSARRC
jgi:hypothetical protein